MRLIDKRRHRLVTIDFEGQPLPAHDGESVAAALAGAGVVAFRQHADGSSRGVHCGMGACFDCVVTIDGQPGRRACMTKVADGMRIGPDTRAPVAPAISRPEHVLTPDVLVVGGGPAGLAAAIAAFECGRDVLLLDERGSLGGQYYKLAGRADPQSRRGDDLRARAAGIPSLAATAWGAFPGPEIAAASDDARWLIRPHQLILAPGAHEAPVPMPGWTLPGCMTTGALQGLVRTHRVSPGQRVVVAGNGPLNLQVAAELVRAGGTVSAVLEAAAEPNGLALARCSPARAWEGLMMIGRLRDAGVPILWNTRSVAVLGEARVDGLAIEGPGGTDSIAADIVALNWGFQAETGLARALGAAHQVVRGRLETVTDEDGQTSLPGIYAVGDGAQMGGARVALHRGRIAGLAAARALGAPTPHPPRASLRRARQFQRALATAFAAPPPTPTTLANSVVVCRCEGVRAGTVRAAMAEGAGSLPAIKRATRAGMGLCNGRFCAATLASFAGAITGTVTEAGLAAPRVPLRPILASAILADRPEPSDTVIAAPIATRWTTAPPAPHPGHAEIVVIGGGLIGLSTALYLARDGADVLLLDRGEPGLVASTANAGSLHVQLVPYVYAADGGGPMAETLPLGPASVALWQALATDAGEDLGLRSEGGLVLAETAAELDLLRAKAAFECSKGVEVRILDPAELRAVAPNLADGFAGASFCPLEGQGDPLRGTMALLSLARRAGVRIAAGLEATGLERTEAGWSIATSAGPVRASQVVNTAGVQAGRIGAYAGIAVPAQGLVQQVIATSAAPPMLRQLVAWTGRHLSLKQGDGGHILIGGGWPGDQDANGAAQLRRTSIEGNIALACRALPPLRDLQIVRAWTGLAPNQNRPPLICATPGAPGLWHGVTGNGYTLAPIVGRMLADAIRTGKILPPAFAL